MKNKKTIHLASVVALASSFLFAGQVHAEDECPTLPQAAVIKAFNDPDARLNHADPAGSCNWSLSNGGTLIATVQKRPKAAEAKIIYDSYRTTLFADLTRGARSPKVGQQAYFGMSAAGAERGAAGFIALQGDTMFVLNYLSDRKIDESIAAPMLELGRLGTERRGNAAQSFGDCEWFTKEEITKILGKGKQTIQRLGVNHCIASVLPDGAALAGMTSKDIPEDVLENMRASSAKSCTVLPLPQFGRNAHATFACGAPGNMAMSVEFLKNGTLIKIIYSPVARPAAAGDAKALNSIIQRAYDRL